MNANENVNKYSLDELKVDSFVTTIPEAEQDMIRGGTGRRWRLFRDLLVLGTMLEFAEYSDYCFNGEYNDPGFNTDPGFFDTSYPCG